jgi:hypothetical protein
VFLEFSDILLKSNTLLIISFIDIILYTESEANNSNCPENIKCHKFNLPSGYPRSCNTFISAKTNRSNLCKNIASGRLVDDKFQCKLKSLQCATSAFVDEPRRMLSIIQPFGKHFSCHLQGECVVVGLFFGSLV